MEMRSGMARWAPFNVPLPCRIKVSIDFLKVYTVYMFILCFHRKRKQHCQRRNGFMEAMEAWISSLTEEVAGETLFNGTFWLVLAKLCVYILLKIFFYHFECFFACLLLASRVTINRSNAVPKPSATSYYAFFYPYIFTFMKDGYDFSPVPCKQGWAKPTKLISINLAARM